MSEHDCTTTPTNELTAEYLRSVLHYEPETGIFTWKVSQARRIRVGDVAGSVRADGYLAVKVRGQIYKAHRLAWLYGLGEWPKLDIDHINRNRSDNRIANLREVTHKQNLQNAGKYSHNTSGHTGVYWYKQTAKWQAQIAHHQKKIHLGFFNTIEEAISARKAAERLYWADTCTHLPPVNPSMQSVDN